LVTIVTNNFWSLKLVVNETFSCSEKTHFLDYPIKKNNLDNTGEYTSHVFHKYCISTGIEVEDLVAHVHS